MPALAPKFRIDDREFNATYKRYLTFTRRDHATVANTKAFYIARRATVETPKASASGIRTSLGKVITRKGIRRATRLARATERNMPLAEAIIRAQTFKRGESQPSQAEMPQLIVDFILRRLRSVAFLKSGWLPAIRLLAPLAERRGVPRQDRTAKEFGVAKGGAKPATAGARVTSMIFNAVGETGKNSGGSRSEALRKYGGPALQRAFDAERLSMLQYIERKLRESAKRSGIKTN